MVPQSQLEVLGEHTAGASVSCSLRQVLQVPEAGVHSSPPPTPLHLPAAPRCTYRPFLEAGARCRVPCLPALCHTAPALVSFNPPSEQAGQRGEDTERDVTGGVGTSPPQASPSLQELGGCARQVAPLYLPAGQQDSWWRMQGLGMGGLVAGSLPAGSQPLQCL